jgi:NADPH2:quinone reductase
MRAVILNEFGPPDRLVPAEVPDPVPAPGQVLINVRYANITFIETQLRAGRAPNPAMLPALPAVLGNGVGGTVAGTGQLVVSATGGSGGYSERAVATPPWPLPVPEGLDLADAVALLADGRTALALADAAEIRPGETVLVEAAAGGVGSLLVQLAAHAGARVVAAVGGARKAAVATSLGADAVCDYTSAEWVQHVSDGVDGVFDGVDVVFDGVGGAIGQAAFGLVRDGGRFLSYGLASGSFTQVSEAESARRDIKLLRGVPVTAEQSRELSARALAEAAAGRLRPLIGQTFPLERAADAHATIEARSSIGKTLLVID